MPKTSRPKSKQESKPKQEQQGSKQDQQKEPSLPEKVSQYQADLAKWSAVAALPSLNAQEAEFARNMVRSSRAALTLGQKALLYQEPDSVQENQQGQSGTTQSPLPPPEIGSPQENPKP
jgi:hypothetical protein